MNQRALEAIELLPATDVTAAEAEEGAVKDLMGYINPGGREMKFILSVTAVSGTTPTMDVKIQQGDASNGSDMTDVTGGAFTQVTTTDSFQTIHCKISKRYIRAVRTSAGTNPVYTVACIGLAEARVSP